MCEYSTPYDQDTNEVNYREFLRLVRLVPGGGNLGAEAKFEDHDALITRNARHVMYEWYRKKDKGKWRQLRTLFQQQDKEKNGKVTPRSFEKVLGRVKLKLSKDDLKNLTLCLDLDDDGAVYYEIFVDMVMNEPERPGDELGAMHKRVTAQLREQRYSGREAGRDIANAFRRQDPDESGKVANLQFKRACVDRLGLTLNPVDMSSICERFDLDGRGTFVDYESFAKWATAGADIDLVERKVGAGLRVIKTVGRSYRRAFEKREETKISGIITNTNFEDAVNALGLAVSEGEVRALSFKYQDRLDRINWKGALVFPPACFLPAAATGAGAAAQRQPPHRSYIDDTTDTTYTTADRCGGGMQARRQVDEARRPRRRTRRRLRRRRRRPERRDRVGQEAEGVDSGLVRPPPGRAAWPLLPP